MFTAWIAMIDRFLKACFVVVPLAGCGTPADAPSSETPSGAVAAVTPSTGSDPLTTAARLRGEYRIAGVDGASIDLPYGVSASISGNRIHVIADCVNLAWDYRFEGALLVTERAAVEGCGRGLTPQEDAIVAAFDAATRVVRTPANGIEFSGGSHRVTLFSQ